MPAARIVTYLSAPIVMSYLAIATGSPPSVLSGASLFLAALVLTAPGRPSFSQATLWLLTLAGCAVVGALKPPALMALLGLPADASTITASAICYTAATVTAVVHALDGGLVGNCALLAAGLDGWLRPLLMRLMPTQLMVIIYSATRNSYVRESADAADSLSCCCNRRWSLWHLHSFW